jgi:hypothetical protein
MRRSDGHWVICETPQGNAIALPAWMTDQTTCACFSLGPCAVSLSALGELRLFLNALHSTAECDKPSRNTSRWSGRMNQERKASQMEMFCERKFISD